MADLDLDSNKLTMLLKLLFWLRGCGDATCPCEPCELRLLLAVGCGICDGRLLLLLRLLSEATSRGGDRGRPTSLKGTALSPLISSNMGLLLRKDVKLAGCLRLSFGRPLGRLALDPSSVGIVSAIASSKYGIGLADVIGGGGLSMLYRFIPSLCSAVSSEWLSKLDGSTDRG